VKDTLNIDLLPSHGDVDSWARLILLLVDTGAQPLWNAAANPSQARDATDDPELSIQQYTQKVEQKIMTGTNP